MCKKCDGDFNINETFIDRAVVHELKRVSFPCYNEKCPWEGSNVDYRVSNRHISIQIKAVTSSDCLPVPVFDIMSYEVIVY